MLSRRWTNSTIYEWVHQKFVQQSSADGSETQNSDCTGSIDLLTIELEDENLLSPKKIHLGFTAEDEVCKLLAAKQIDEVLVKELRLQSRTFIAKIF